MVTLIRYRNNTCYRINEVSMGIELSLSNALWLLHDISLDMVHDENRELSPRQLTILLTVYL